MKIIDYLFPKIEEYNFFIYTNKYLDTNDPNEIAMKFYAFNGLNYSNESNIPSEYLEDGQITTDSIQRNPSYISIQVKHCPQFANIQDFNNSCNEVVENLKKWEANKTLLTIMNNYPIFSYYSNLLIKKIEYENTTFLNINLLFQQVNIYNFNLQNTKVKNPEDKNIINAGRVNTKETNNKLEIL